MTAVMEPGVLPGPPDLKKASTAKGVKKATRAELLDLVEKMQQDWVQLNIFLNATAINYSWCSDYENRLGRYNAAFKVLRLQGRPQQSVNRNGGTAYTLATTVLAALRIKHVKIEARLADASTEELAKHLWQMSYPNASERDWVYQLTASNKNSWRQRAKHMIDACS
jgi:hypothetical protein